MSAARLREAAGRLRDLATPVAAPIAEDRWFSRHEMRKAMHDQFHFYDRTQESADFIATMSPPVALALADWLEMEEEACGTSVELIMREALAVADAILGSES